MRQLNAAEAEDAQHMWHKECKYSRRFANITPPFGFCEMKNGNGRIDMLVAGNSFACNQGDVIYKAFKRYARQFNIFCLPRYEMFYPNCPIPFNFTHIVKELKPEVVFMIDRAVITKAPLNVSKPIDEDRAFGLFMKTLILLEKTTRKVYILQALPSCKLGCAHRAVNYLQKGRPLNTMKASLLKCTMMYKGTCRSPRQKADRERREPKYRASPKIVPVGTIKVAAFRSFKHVKFEKVLLDLLEDVTIDSCVRRIRLPFTSCKKSQQSNVAESNMLYRSPIVTLQSGSVLKDGLIEKDEFFFFARHRIWEIGKRCKNCEIVDYMPELVDKKGHYLGYNPETNLMYLNCNNHFNTFGKQRIQIVFDELAKKFTMFTDG
ncbi:unnamed protein product [Cylicocyclus nassatus]|uniref:SGNH domain-containing protein n=1 Tax=Cylicocyclus nassatus TaxID=53992 RepID=A0AA36H8H5_CYLNA|nr:unnamed protein product [Cylicocyclus nassatus]